MLGILVLNTKINENAFRLSDLRSQQASLDRPGAAAQPADRRPGVAEQPGRGGPPARAWCRPVRRPSSTCPTGGSSGYRSRPPARPACPAPRARTVGPAGRSPTRPAGRVIATRRELAGRRRCARVAVPEPDRGAGPARPVAGRPPPASVGPPGPVGAGSPTRGGTARAGAPCASRRRGSRDTFRPGAGARAAVARRAGPGRAAAERHGPADTARRSGHGQPGPPAPAQSGGCRGPPARAAHRWPGSAATASGRAAPPAGCAPGLGRARPGRVGCGRARARGRRGGPVPSSAIGRRDPPRLGDPVRRLRLGYRAGDGAVRGDRRPAGGAPGHRRARPTRADRAGAAAGHDGDLLAPRGSIFDRDGARARAAASRRATCSPTRPGSRPGVGQTADALRRLLGVPGLRAAADAAPARRATTAAGSSSSTWPGVSASPTGDQVERAEPRRASGSAATSAGW